MNIISCQPNGSILTSRPLYAIAFFESNDERGTAVNWSRINVFHARRYMTQIISHSNNKMYMIRTFVLLAGNN